ncbi:unnamed protein product, partial [Rodentolepis nana]|uniref:Bravo_FIGEY domain-containing protein n=1 Tax=Rodentolepis nana TaxID=102285 RepID=A0A0R3TH54_RODNA
MQCIDRADFPTVVRYEKESFEDDLLDIKVKSEPELLVCGYHPRAPNPVALEGQELDWKRCNHIYQIFLIIAVAIVVLIHLQFIITFLQAKIKRTHHKQTHLHTDEKEKKKLPERNPESDLTVTSSTFPATTTDKTSDMKNSNVSKLRFPSGMTQEDYIDFERYEHF